MLTGWAIYHMVADTRSTTPRLLATANSAWWGPSVARSDDGGATWDQRCEGLGFPRDMGIALGNVWHLRLGLDSQPGVVFAGTDPAGVFRSDDSGVSWASVEGINRHKLRPFWRPVPGVEQGVMEVWMEEGEDAAQAILDHIDEPIEDDLTRRRAAVQNDLGGMAHSIEIDPRDASRMYVSISAGGSYVTSDGGETWEMFQHQPDPVEPVGEALISQLAANVDASVDPAAHFDMHTMRLDPKRPDRLWGQAHTGVYRSDDGGRTWVDASPDLPTFHAFPIAVTRREPDAAFIVPLVNDDFRVAGGQLTVYRTRDAGASWGATDRGTAGTPRLPERLPRRARHRRARPGGRLRRHEQRPGLREPGRRRSLDAPPRHAAAGTLGHGHRLLTCLC
jgi:photosystem II stability/assembly factor-like uncharacterized protein